MQTIGDIIQAISRQRGRGENGPLLMLRSLDAVAGERISHLPIDQLLSQSWLAHSGEPFRPHQAQALAAIRRGDPVALRASAADIAATIELLLRATLAEQPEATALLLAVDNDAARTAYATLAESNGALPRVLQAAVTHSGAPRIDPFARVVVATPEVLHHRLLRHHERGWSGFWQALRLIVMPDLHTYAGVAGAHLADLLVRAQRVAAIHDAHPSLLASLFEVAEPAPALTALLGHPWRIVNADDGPRPATIVAAWQGGGARLRETIDLVSTMQRQSYRVHVACSELERAVLAPAIGDLAGVSLGPGIAPAQVLVCVGFPGSISRLKRLLASGYQAVVVVLGELPHEQLLTRHVSMLLGGSLTVWPTPPSNAYVLAQHILCAASELPLTDTEVTAWGCADVVERMAASNQLVELPDVEPIWIPAGERDPYEEFSLLAASGQGIIAHSEQPKIRSLLDPTLFERWAFGAAALPPGAGGLRVVTRDEEAGSISLRLETSVRRTYPLRRGTVTIRELREERKLFGQQHMSWGRVVVQEEIYGYREAAPGAAPVDVGLHSPLENRWVAPACWFELPAALQVQGQFAGWSLSAALPLRVLASFTDLTPMYDHERRRLFFIDSQPGGNGLAQWVYQHAEELLPLAYDVALACRADPLLEPLSRVDQDWLLALLGRTPVESLPPRRTESAPAMPEEPTPARDDRRGSSRRDERRSTRPTAGGPRSQTQLPFRTPVEPPVEPPPSRAPAEPPVEPPVRREPVEPSPVHAPVEPPVEPPPVRAPVEPPSRAPAEPPVEPPVRRAPAEPPPARAPAETAMPSAPADEPMPDAAALIARLRRQREQREQQVPRAASQATADANIQPRFRSGERVFCLPYGDGDVISSRIEHGRELLQVRFPDHGELTIDPAVSLVRKLDAPAEDDGGDI